MESYETYKSNGLKAEKTDEKIKNEIKCLLVEHRVIFMESSEAIVANFNFKSMC
jgi:hypothetical protein